jgi:hypothetical protein
MTRGDNVPLVLVVAGGGSTRSVVSVDDVMDYLEAVVEATDDDSALSASPLAEAGPQASGSGVRFPESLHRTNVASPCPTHLLHVG